MSAETIFIKPLAIGSTSQQKSNNEQIIEILSPRWPDWFIDHVLSVRVWRRSAFC